jgi:hypothetical protein
MYMAAAHAGNFICFSDENSGGAEFCSEELVIGATKRRVCLLRGTKIRFDPEMNLYRAALKPTSAAKRQFGRLGNFCHAQNAGVEGAGCVFRSGGHGQLHMVDGGECCSSRAQGCVLQPKTALIFLPRFGSRRRESGLAKIHCRHAVMIGPACGQSQKCPGAGARLAVEPGDVFRHLRVVR